MKCPTCGSDCEIYSSGEGTNSYISVDVKAEKLELLDKVYGVLKSFDNKMPSGYLSVIKWEVDKLKSEVENE